MHRHMINGTLLCVLFTHRSGIWPLPERESILGWRSQPAKYARSLRERSTHAYNTDSALNIVYRYITGSLKPNADRLYLIAAITSPNLRRSARQRYAVELLLYDRRSVVGVSLHDARPPGRVTPRATKEQIEVMLKLPNVGGNTHIIHCTNHWLQSHNNIKS